MVCLSYRGYWSSKGRPSEQGINSDAAAALQWVSDLHAKTYAGAGRGVIPLVLLWGQSIGAAIATNLAARADAPADALDVDGIILETPFLSARALLAAIYPQKWLPYKHIWPFLWNPKDTLKNLAKIAAAGRRKSGAALDILIVEAGRDELVSAEHGQKLYKKCIELGLAAEMRTVHGAYHNKVIVMPEGRLAVSDYIIGRIERLVE